MRPAVAVIVVSYNTKELLRRCLASLELTSVPLRAVVVDNASTDGSPAMVAADFPAVELIASGKNLGFAAANNVALRHMGIDAGRLAEDAPPYALLLNPDAELTEGALEALVDFLEAHPRVAMAGPRLRYPSGAPQHAAFHFPTLAMSVLDLFPPRGPLLGRLYDSPLNGRYRRDGGDAPFAIDHPLGAAMLARSSVIAEVGLLDERYWLYSEEVDWCYRIRRAGWAIWQVPAATVLHVGGASTRQFRAHSFLELHRNRLRFFESHYRPDFVRRHRLILRAAALRDLLATLLPPRRLAAEERQRAWAAGELLHLSRDASWRSPGRSDAPSAPAGR